LVSDEQFNKLDRKIDLIMKLLAIDKLYGKKLIDQVEILTRFGMRPSEIGSILGTTTENIGSQQSKLRKRAGSKLGNQ
jgi:hypothetical protein